MIPNLPPVPLQYAHFARAQRQWLPGEPAQQQLDYWQQKLAGNFSEIQFPGVVPDRLPHRDPSTKQTYLPARLTGLFPLALARSLGELSQRWDGTLFVTLIAAFNVLVYRYSGQEDLLMSFANPGRDRPEIERTIGLFANPLFLRTNLTGEPTFAQLGDRVHQTAIEAYRHQDVPYEKVVEAIEPDPNARSPLFQVKFALNPAASEGRGMAPVELPDLSISYIPEYIDVSETRYDLTLIVQERETGLAVEFAYNPDLFAPETIERMLGHYQTLLAGIVANPTGQISKLPILTAQETAQQVQWNQTQKQYSPDCIHQLFEQQVARTPEAIALICEDRQFTYDELNARANKLANYLTKLAVAPDVLVGICLERSLDLVVGLLGILKAGGAYVPLDAAYPQDRLAYMLANSEVKVLISSQHLKTQLPTQNLEVVCLDTDWAQIETEDAANLDTPIQLQNLGYAIYTSGSTGVPKCVAMPHLALSNLIQWQIEQPRATERPKTLQFSPISFDVSCQEMFSTWGEGGTLVLITEEQRVDPFALLNVLEQQAIERLFLPFVALQQLAEVAVRTKLFPQHLREIITAGEQLQITPGIRKFFTTLSNCTLHNHYGPSESHVVTTYTLSDKVANWSPLPPIGVPIANTQIYVFDRHLQPVPIGASGELYIGGDCLSRGYFNRPDLTAERFIPHRDRADTYLYKTGDLVRYLSDGQIEYLGRIDNQVKIRGFRIALGEIETVLGEHPAISQITAIVREDIPGDKKLVAYYVADPDAPPTVSELKSFIAKKVPNYMVPSLFVMLPALPMTPNGKVDRSALPIPDYTRQAPANTFVPPSNQVEIELIKIWQKVLGIQSIGIKDNFFDLGGHSLLAVRIFAEIEELYGKNLPLATLFQAETISALADVISQQQWTAPWSSLVPLVTAGSQSPVFCIHSVGGNILEYHKLAHYLGADRPVYALQSQGLDGQHEPLTSVEEMARHYLTEIQSVQPQGGYSLVGYSFGGTIAYEMAQQLLHQGQRVDLLALLDTKVPRLIDLKPSIATQIKIHLTNLSHLDLAEKKQYIWDRIKYRTGTSPSYRSTIIAEFAKTNPLSPTYLKLLDNNLDANDRYLPQPYPGKVTLFRCQIQNVKVAPHQDLGWGNLAIGGLDIQQIPGNHMGLLKEPNAKAIAAKLQDYLPHNT